MGLILGIDLRPLQTGHKFRGIGEVAKQVTNNLLNIIASDKANKISKVIFYEFNGEDPKKLIEIPKNIKTETIKLGYNPETKKNKTRTEKIQNSFNSLYGKPVKGSNKVDYFIQYAYEFGVPKDTKTLLFIHDFIPDIFWDDFFESPLVPFKNRALRTTIRTIYTNYRHNRLQKRALKDAYKIIAVSESTKNDAIKLYHIKPNKIIVDHLGVSKAISKTTETADDKISEKKITKPYLLFIGAADQRRPVVDLIDAFNNLKADNRDIQLVLVGENFKSAKQIPTISVREAVMNSSYKDDIILTGYISDEFKQKLYKDALVFVYPTLYEGFGIPILEALQYGCRVITYNNSSTHEVGSDRILYAKNWEDIVCISEKLLLTKKNNIKDDTYTEKFTWSKTAQKIYKII